MLANSRGAAALLVLLGVAACDVRTPTAGDIGSGRAGGAGGGLDTRLVGRWSRTILFQDAQGSLHSSRTTWRFSPDASAARSVVSANLTFGLVDSVVTPARWRTSGGALMISYLPEGTGNAQFDYRFQETRLNLGGILFDRVQ